MRILTVRQPWAWAIIHGGKDVENRVRNIAGDYRGPVAIHAGLAFDDEALTSPVLHAAWQRAGGEVAAGGWGVPYRGRILGVVDLVDVTPWTPHVAVPVEGAPWILQSEPRTPVGWEMRDHWHLRLANPRPLAEPIPYKGALGLRTLDDDTAARILAQIGA